MSSLNWSRRDILKAGAMGAASLSAGCKSVDQRRTERSSNTTLLHSPHSGGLAFRAILETMSYPYYYEATWDEEEGVYNWRY